MRLPGYRAISVVCCSDKEFKIAENFDYFEGKLCTTSPSFEQDVMIMPLGINSYVESKFLMISRELIIFS